MTITRRAFAAAAFATPTLSLVGASRMRAATAKPEYGDHGIDLTARDLAVAPGDDFFRHTNGAWLKTATIPPDRSNWGAGARINENTQARTRAIMESAAASGNANGRKIADYYGAWTDEARLEALGTAPLKPELAKAAAVQSPADLARALARASWNDLANPNGAGRMGPMPMDVGVSVDIMKPTTYVPALSQAGLGMPDRDYYLVDNTANQRVQAAYKGHLAKLFALAGFDDAEGRAGRVYALEARLAAGHRTREANRQTEKRYNPFARADFATKAPGLEWDAYLDAAGFAGQGRFIVAQPEAIAAVAAAARDVPLADWRDYLALKAIRNFAPCGPKTFREEDFDFNGRTLSGTPQMPVAWKTAVTQTDRALGQAVGQIYLARHFPPASQAMVTEMTRNLKASMAQRIRKLPWMTPQTKTRALAKLANLRVEVGGQNPPRDYSTLEVKPGEAFVNLLSAQDHARRRILGRLGKPVDRREWSMNPQTINAQSNSVLVKVMFPAGYLQPPNFDPAADPAVNYGAIGRVIGHEISHQFDDQGSKFDDKGALDNWWTAEDLEKFRAAGAGLAAQYDAYEPLPGLHINGRLTLGENIGDLAGLSMALDAYHASLDGKPAPVLDGLTGDQRFFLSFAQTHRSLQRENALRQQLLTDPHSPNEWRTAEVRNVDAWYEAFGVKPGQKMYLPPEGRVRVW
jgi:putative endopeptidase